MSSEYYGTSIIRHCAIDQSHKSYNAHVTYSTIHQSEQKCSHSVLNVGYGIDATWDLWDWSIAACKLMLLNAKTYTQKLSPSTQLFGILVTMNSSYFLCPAKTDRYQHGWENLYTSHSIFVIRKGASRVFRHRNIISSMLPMMTDCTLLVSLRQLTFVTELSVTFFIDLVLICRHTLPSVL